MTLRGGRRALAAGAAGGGSIVAMADPLQRPWDYGA